MKKAILFAIISILAGACSSPKDQAKASPDGTMFEDIPATFDSSQHRPLHMAVALKADSFLVIGARGGFLPNTYYTTLTEHIGPSSADFRKRKPNVQYAAIHKELRFQQDLSHRFQRSLHRAPRRRERRRRTIRFAQGHPRQGLPGCKHKASFGIQRNRQGPSHSAQAVHRLSRYRLDCPDTGRRP